MSIDTPATIAILSAGPIGLESALYARYLGYQVILFERDRVAENVRRWGHVRMFSPWRMNVSSLGLAALEAQAESWQPPPPDEHPTGQQLYDNYLQPLASSDLLADSLREQHTVLRIGKQRSLKGEKIGSAARGEEPFTLLVRDAEGRETLETADAVIDASGTFANHNWLGPGGIPAIGESSADNEYGLPDILGADRDVYAGQRVLLVGSGYTAATNAVALAQLAGTKVHWLTRRADPPIARIANDRLPLRDELAQRANQLAAEGDPVTHWPETTVERIEPADQGGWLVHTTRAEEEPLHVDRILASVGYRPDNSLHSELQVHHCYASDGPMKLAAALLGAENTSGDCLDQTSAGPQALLSPEPNFYVLGAKSYGRNSRFLISLGLAQIQELFTILGDRPTLDLYASLRKQPT